MTTAALAALAEDPERYVEPAECAERVVDGPGINDDGSGVSMMMETAEQMDALGITPRNKVRFIFFSGEEQGLLGSDFYVSELTKKEISSISAMLDYDMLASPNYARSTTATATSTAWPARTAPGSSSRSSRTSGTARAWRTTIPFDGRSDYDAFTGAGIPAGGIFAGAEVKKTAARVAMYGGTAGVAFDRCYHQLCDDMTNLNDKGLREHTDAAVHAILTFAQTTSAVNGTSKASGTSIKPWDWKGSHQVH